jgi:hypothetical protein
MLIEVLYIPGCPNHALAVDRIRKVLRSEALDASIQEIAVTEESVALSLHFGGSPTVRVNGSDVEKEPKQTGLACRLYAGGEGLPSEESLRRAFSAARNGATQ